MKSVVLLSDARHPVSGRAVLSRLEAQAIGLGTALGGTLTGLHAGDCEDGVQESLGHGLSALDILSLPPEADPVSALTDFLKAQKADLILAGRRGEGGFDSGLLPYALAEALGLPILADAVALTPGEATDTLVVDQALAKGARRRVTVRLPALVTVHPLAPAPLPFAFGAMRRGTIRRHVAEAADASTDPVEERPYRARPKLMRTSSATASAENLHVGPEPEEAARLILDYLESNGIRRYG
ncbi:adenine nucleotide alpha hydrolase family protein [Jiella marina]|uniref:electron transfer flavoprotein subunit beta n=1 Tax=Jiella sp. LLJ827 TaxID=2917712 RepID=UPI002100E0C6|nr:electron transfer flavoprotein subunit beta [Jiella sp. LLJ827]